MPKRTRAQRRQDNRAKYRKRSAIELRAEELTWQVIAHIPDYAPRAACIRHHFIEALARDAKNPWLEPGICSREDTLFRQLVPDQYLMWNRRPPKEICLMFGTNRILVKRNTGEKNGLWRGSLFGQFPGHRKLFGFFIDYTSRPQFRRRSQAARKSIKKEYLNICSEPAAQLVKS